MHIYLPCRCIFFLDFFIHRKSQWSARGITWRLQEMQYTQIPAYFSYFTCSQSAEEEEVAWLVAAAESCSAERSAQSFRDGKEGCRERDGNYLSLASSCQPLSGFRSSATEWRETNKSEKRQAGKGDMLPQESTCLVDLFLGTPCANYTISLCGCDEKQSSGCKLKSCSSFLLFIALGSLPPWGVFHKAGLAS